MPPDLGFMELTGDLLGMLISVGLPTFLPTKDKDSVLHMLVEEYPSKCVSIPPSLQDPRDSDY